MYWFLVLMWLIFAKRAFVAVLCLLSNEYPTTVRHESPEDVFDLVFGLAILFWIFGLTRGL